jgi:hypothetical protein
MTMLVSLTPSLQGSGDRPVRPGIVRSLASDLRSSLAPVTGGEPMTGRGYPS